MSRHGNPPRTALRIAAQVCVVLALVVGVVILVDRGLDRQRQADKADGVVAEVRAPGDPPTDLFDADPSLLVVGDSFTEGAGDPAIEKAYPTLVGEAFGWSTTVDAQGGRGFLPTDVSQFGFAEPVPPVADRLDYDAAHYKADYIIVDSGRNDLGGKDPAEVVAAMDDYATRLRAAYPKAVIVLMVPSYFTPDAAATYPLIAPAYGTVAAKIGAYVIDPHADGWYEGVDLTPLTWEDGFHPNARGHQFYADKVSDALKRLGIEPFQRPAQGAG